MGGAKGPSDLFGGTRGNPQGSLPLGDSSGGGDNSLPSDASQTSHMFGNREGHLPDTPSNRRLIQDLANDDSCRLGEDKWGNEWYARINADGSQT